MSLPGKTVVGFLLVALVALTGLSGCQSNTSALFTKPELLTRDRLAVLGLDLEQEQIFMAAYVKTFVSRPVTFVERAQLNAVLGEQDLLKDYPEERLDPATRAKIEKIWGVKALIICKYDPGDKPMRGPRKLRVRIVDSETGAIIGSVMTENYGDFASHARMAVEALKADLLSGPKVYPALPALR